MLLEDHSLIDDSQIIPQLTTTFGLSCMGLAERQSRAPQFLIASASLCRAFVVQQNLSATGHLVSVAKEMNRVHTPITING